MSMIRMETENVRDTASKIDFAVQELTFKPRRLKSAANSLKSAWRGRQASKLAGELKRKAKILDTEVANLQQLAQRMRNEVREWEGSDTLGAEKWGGVVNYKSFSPLNSQILAQEENEEFNWRAWSGAIGAGGLGALEYLNVGADAVEVAKQVPLTGYESFGRTINGLIRKPHGGYVGKMDKLGHLVKSVDKGTLKKIKVAGAGLSFGFGVMDDLGKGDNAFHAVFSEGLETAANIGIRLIPGIGTAMLIYDASLLAGRLVAGGMEAFGLHEEAAWLQNAIEVIDIGTYTDKIADGISDFVENTATKFWDWL
jgi:uncharacterized protein YukE